MPGKTIRVVAWLLALAVWATSAAAGCRRESPRISGDKLRGKIKADVESQTGMTVTAIECPDSRPIRKGDVFVCVVRMGDDASLTMTVTQLDDQGTVQTTSGESKGITTAARVAAQIGHWVAGRTGQQPRVDCGAGARRTREANLFTCTATFPDGSWNVIDVFGGGEETDIRWTVRGAAGVPATADGATVPPPPEPPS